MTNLCRVQDSLWNVKHPNGEVVGANGYITAQNQGYYGEAAGYPGQYHPAQHQHPGQQQMQAYEDYTHYPHPDEYLNAQNRAAYFAGGDRYAVPNKPRQRLESDCKYTNLTFTYYLKDFLLIFIFSHIFYSRNCLLIKFIFSDSPYGDVSGLPDPYTGHDISDELLRQQHGGHGLDGHSNTGISLQSHETGDMGHHEGYSTPSRRVIREIIV